MIDGVLNVNKEAGYTSHDVVAKLRNILGQKKAGHMGTLDPEATGVLLVCMGKATRLCGILKDMRKTYIVDLLLGVETDTQDMTGTILERRAVCVTEKEVRQAAAGFLGEQMQIPPMYSARKVNGRKLYELAREGKVIDREPRPVTFYEIRILSIALPHVKLQISCSSGTYIRTFCHDLGKKLGCKGAMEHLIRIQAGQFTLLESHTIDEIAAYRKAGRIGELVREIEKVLEFYPAFFCAPQQDKMLHNGNPLERKNLQAGEMEGRVRAYDSSGRFVAVYEPRPGNPFLYPVKMFF